LEGRLKQGIIHLSLGILDAFTIGAENAAEQDDLLHRIAAVNA